MTQRDAHIANWLLPLWAAALGIALALTAPSSQAGDGLRGGMEITVQIPPEFQGDRTRWPEAVEKLKEQLQSQGFEIYDNYVRDPKTRAVFFISPDNGAIEIRTPPMWSWQAESTLKPIFECTSRLGWTHTTGGGHIHLDLLPFKKDPRRFVNFLIFFHNHPLAERIFLPVEGESTLFQRGLQNQFIAAVEEFREIRVPNWDDVTRIFGRFLSDKHISMRLHANTLEIRSIGNQKYPAAGALELKFYERIWAKSQGGDPESVVRWNFDAYTREISHLHVKAEAEHLFAALGLRTEDYHNFINDYDKTRRRAMERAVANHSAEAFFYLENKEEYLRTLLHQIKHAGSQARFWAFQQLDTHIKDLNTHPDLLAAVLEALDDPDLDIRQFAWKQLEKFDWQRVEGLTDRLIQQLEKESRPGQAALAFYRLRYLRWTKNPKLRNVILNAFESKNPHVPSLILDHLPSPEWQHDPELRKRVISSLSNSNGEICNSAWKRLQELRWFEDPELRAKVIAALDDPGTYARRNAILRMADIPWHQDPPLKTKVIQGLRSASGPVRQATLERLADFAWHEDSELSKAVFHALNDPDDYVARAAALRLLDFKWYENPRLLDRVIATLTGATLTGATGRQARTATVASALALLPSFPWHKNPKLREAVRNLLIGDATSIVDIGLSEKAWEAMKTADWSRYPELREAVWKGLQSPWESHRSAAAQLWFSGKSYYPRSYLVYAARMKCILSQTQRLLAPPVRWR